MARNKVKFKGRKHSIKGILSMVIGIVSLAGLVILSVISGVSGGMGGGEFGVIGIACFAFSITGFVMSIKSLKERDIFLAAPVTALLLNSITMITFFVLYLIGICLPA